MCDYVQCVQVFLVLVEESGGSVDHANPQWADLKVNNQHLGAYRYNIGGEFDLADWQMHERIVKLNSVNDVCKFTCEVPIEIFPPNLILQFWEKILQIRQTRQYFMPYGNIQTTSLKRTPLEPLCVCVCVCCL